MWLSREALRLLRGSGCALGGYPPLQPTTARSLAGELFSQPINARIYLMKIERPFFSTTFS